MGEVTAEEEEWEGPRHRAALATWTYVLDMPVGVTLSRVKAMPAWEEGRKGEGDGSPTQSLSVQPAIGCNCLVRMFFFGLFFWDILHVTFDVECCFLSSEEVMDRTRK